MPNDTKLVNLADLKEAYDDLDNKKKDIQTAVTDPTAIGTSATFIDSINQDAQGVITATKKTVALSADDVDAIAKDIPYTFTSNYTGNEVIPLYNATTDENYSTSINALLSQAGGGGSSQGALVNYKKTVSLSAGSSSQSFNDTNITGDMVVLEATIDNPAAQGSDWNVTTADGTVTITGTVSAATNVTLYFGVGVTTAPSILTNLGSTSADNILKTAPRPGVMGVLGVPNGGTGATTSDQAAQNITGCDWDIYTENTYSTWVLVLDNGILKHRVLSAWLNNMDIVPVNHGGTGATSAAVALANLGVINRQFSVTFDSNGVGTVNDPPQGYTLMAGNLNANWTINVHGATVIARSTSNWTTLIKDSTVGIILLYVKTN